MAIITKEAVKTLIGIPAEDVSRDALIDLLIPEVESWLKSYLNDPMKNADNEDVYPSGIKLPFAQLIKFELDVRPLSIGKSSDNLADWSTSFAKNTNGYPEDILGLFNSFIKPPPVVFL